MWSCCQRFASLSSETDPDTDFKYAGAGSDPV
jgi:hypothetical protein